MAKITQRFHYLKSLTTAGKKKSFKRMDQITEWPDRMLIRYRLPAIIKMGEGIKESDLRLFDFTVDSIEFMSFKCIFIVLYRLRYINLCTPDMLADLYFVVGDCSMYCTIFSSIPGLYPLDASSIPRWSCGKQKDLPMWPNILWAANVPG